MSTRWARGSHVFGVASVALLLACNEPVDVDAGSSGSPGGGGAGGSSETTTCTPGAQEACYEGPAGTQDVGACRAGTRTCDEQGMAWGPCVGQQLPAAEDCGTPEDDDCDGAAPVCPGSHLWSQRFGYEDQQASGGVAAGDDGNVAFAGTFYSAMDLGGDVLVADGSDHADVFVASFRPDGTHRWSKRFGGADQDQASGVAADSGGNVFLAGSFSGAIDFTGAPLQSMGDGDAFVAKLDPEGSPLWSRALGGTGEQMVEDLAVDSAGGVVGVGSFDGTMNIGPEVLASAGDFDAYVVKLGGTTGATLWGKRFGDASGAQVARCVAVDASGNIVVAGTFEGTIDLGGGPLVSEGPMDAFVVKLSPSGEHLWSKRFGGCDEQNIAGVAVDGDGNILLTGMFNGALDLGGGPLESVGGDAFLAKLDAAGEHRWSKRFGGDAEQTGIRVAVGATGDVYLVARGHGPVDFGGGPREAGWGSDGFVASFGPSGDHRWSMAFGDAGGWGSSGVTLSGAGSLVVTGSFTAAVDFGGGPLESSGADDVFLAALTP